MSWKVFIDTQAEELEVPPQVLRKFLSNLLDEIQRRLLNKRSVVLKGIASLTITKRKPTNKVNPQTGLVERLPSRHRISFKPSREMNRKLDEKFER